MTYSVSGRALNSTQTKPNSSGYANRHFGHQRSVRKVALTIGGRTECCRRRRRRRRPGSVYVSSRIRSMRPRRWAPADKAIRPRPPGRPAAASFYGLDRTIQRPNAGPHRPAAAAAAAANSQNSPRTARSRPRSGWCPISRRPATTVERQNSRHALQHLTVF